MVIQVLVKVKRILELFHNYYKTHELYIFSYTNKAIQNLNSNVKTFSFI